MMRRNTEDRRTYLLFDQRVMKIQQRIVKHNLMIEKQKHKINIHIIPSSSGPSSIVGCVRCRTELSE